MSNPFRRKITAERPGNIPGTGTTHPLSINTGTKAEKHVRIASPPDTAISPASYPSSPEFQRLTPSPPQSILPYNLNAGLQTPASGLFVATDNSEDEDDEVVASEALRNTRLNIASTRAPPTVEASRKQEDVIQNTLSKFTSRPRDARTQAAQSAADASKQDSRRQTMDVDAFTRLLLTGGSMQDPSGPVNATTTAPPNLSESSSTADSASISRQSIFEPLPPIAAESPRTSHELDEADAAAARRSGSSSEAMKKPPPAPRPRHGKPIKQAPTPAPTPTLTLPEETSPESDLNKPLPPPPASESSRRGSAASIAGTDPSIQIKRPPTPPLTRRRSQGPSKPPLSRSSPSLQSLTLVQSPPSSSSLPQASKAPLPPPSRRSSQRFGEATKSPGLASTSEETDAIDLSRPIMPKLSRTMSSATRASVISSDGGPPPLPPPRKHRGSSNASQRPMGMTHSPVTGSRRDSIEGPRPGLETTGKIAEGSGMDILKDLASLQAEIDALKRQGLN